MLSAPSLCTRRRMGSWNHVGKLYEDAKILLLVQLCIDALMAR